MLDCVQGFVALFTADGRVMDLNRPLADLAGGSGQDVVGQRFLDTPLFARSDGFRRTLADSLLRAAGGEPVAFEGSVIEPGGVVRRLASRVVPVVDDSGVVCRLVACANDVTDAHRAMDTLKGMLNASTQGLFEFEPESGEFRWSDRVYDLFHLDSTAPPPGLETVMEWVEPEERERTNALLERCIATGEPYDNTVPMTLPDGRRMWIRARATRLEATPTRPVTLVGSVSDVTESHEREAELIATAGRLRGILEATNDGIYEVDVDRERVYWSHRMYELMGVRPREYLTLSESFRHVHPDEVETASAAFQEALRLPLGTLTTVERRMVRLDGRVVNIRSSYKIQRRNGRLWMTGAVTDVTRQQAAEQALAASEQYYRNLFDNAHDAILIVSDDEDETILDANPRAFDLYGYRRDELVGRSLGSLAASNGHAGAIRSSLQRGDQPGIETTHVRGNGRPMVLEINASRIDYRGTPAILTINRDITERKRNEEALRRRERQFRDLLESAPDAMVIVGPADQIEFVNAGAEELFRVPRTELLGRPVEDLIPVELRVGHRRLRDGFNANPVRRPMQGRFVQARRPDGTEFNCEISLGPIKTVDGPMVCATIRDVSDRLRQQEAVRREKDRLQTVLNVAGVMLVGIDRHGTVDLINPLACEILGRTEEEMIGADWFDTCVPDEERETIRQAFFDWFATRQDGVQYIEHPVMTRDGSQRLVAWHNSLIADTGGDVTGMLGSGEDITERRRIEGQLRRTAKMEAIGQLAGGVAHDFNNLLGVILGTVELARDHLESGTLDPDRLIMDLESIERAGSRAARITRQLLAFGRRDLVLPTPIDLNHAVRDMEAMLRQLVRENIELQFDLTDPVATVHSDPGHIEQVILNLVLNARDVMPDGGTLVVGTRMTEAVRKPGGDPIRFSELFVRDTGPGMDSDLVERIFDPFFTTKDVDQGTGLGLAVVHGHVTQWGGHVAVDTDRGAGTTMRVLFPAQNVAPADRARTDQPSVGGSGTLLLCEDNSTLRELAARKLVALGYTVLEAGNGDQAVELARHYHGHIDMLITDVIMPGRNGCQVADTIRGSRPDIRVLYVSGYTSTVLDQYGVPSSGVDFMQKPVTPQQIANRVATMLAAPGA